MISDPDDPGPGPDPSQVYWSDVLGRYLLPKEKLNVHLMPVRRSHCEQMGLDYPWFKDN